MTTRQKLQLSYWVGYIVFMCFFFYFDTIDQYRNSEKIKAVVVDELIGYGRRGREYSYPQIQFIYNDSAWFFGHESSLSAKNIGDSVTVIFPEGEPEKAQKYSFFPYWISLTKLFFSFMISLFLFMIPVFLRMYGGFKREYKGR
jgi:hypothetical protein